MLLSANFARYPELALISAHPVIGMQHAENTLMGEAKEWENFKCVCYSGAPVRYFLSAGQRSITCRRMANSPRW